MRRRLLAGLLAAGAAGCGDASPPPRQALVIADATAPPSAAPSTAASPAPASVATAPVPALPLARAILEEKSTREARDRTLWSAEEEAQRHEAVFVALWDALRGGEPWAVLRTFPAREVVVPALGPPERLAHGVTRRAAKASGGRALTRGEWPVWLNGWQRDGLEIHHTEWHHERFEPGDPARSHLKFELHVRQGGTRHVVTGLLEVAWSEETDGRTGARSLIPRRITTANVVVQSLPEPTAFDVWRVEPIGPNRPMSVIAHDLDGDGRPEILLPGENKVVRLRGSGFITDRLGPEILPGTDAAVLADFDGDGYPDLLGAGRKDGQLVLAAYASDAEGHFLGPPNPVVDLPEPLQKVRVFAVGDVDADGDLDLWLGQYRGAYQGGRMPAPFHDANDGYPGYLLLNQGDGTFRDATAGSGLAAKRHRHTQSASFFDQDGDGHLDLLLVNDFAGIDLFRGDGRGHFTDVTDAVVDQRRLFGMAHTFADFNGDGRLDLLATGMSSTTVRRLNALDLTRPEFPGHKDLRTAMTFGNRLLLGTADGKLAQAPFAADVAASGWSWGTVALDVENDGDEDLFVANGFISGRTARDYCTRYWRHDVYFDNAMEPAAAGLFLGDLVAEFEGGMSWNGFEHNRLFINENKGFREGGFLYGLGGEADARNVIATDLDLDGRTDLVLTEAPPGGDLRLRIMRNVTAAAGAWIGVRVAGARPFGAQITVEAGGRRRAALVAAGDSFMSQRPTDRVFGLGDRASVDRLVVRWPDGAEVVREKPMAGRWHRITRPVR